MTVYANILQVTGPAFSGGTILANTSLAPGSTWTRLSSLESAIPPGGAHLLVYSSAEPFRFTIIPPVSATNASSADVLPRDNGILVPNYGGTTASQTLYIERGSQVWVKQA